MFDSPLLKITAFIKPLCDGANNILSKPDLGFAHMAAFQESLFFRKSNTFV